MSRLRLSLTRIPHLRRSERGATATEYGLLVGFIAFAIIVGVTAFGGAVNTWYDRLAVVVAGF